MQILSELSEAESFKLFRRILTHIPWINRLNYQFIAGYRQFNVKFDMLRAELRVLISMMDVSFQNLDTTLKDRE